MEEFQNINTLNKEKNLEMNNVLINELNLLSEKNEDLKNLMQKFSLLNINTDKVNNSVADILENNKISVIYEQEPTKIKDFQNEKKRFEDEKKYIIKNSNEKAERVS